MTVQPLQPLEQASDEGLFPIVGIGASAGGLEAFSQLLHHLPRDTGMAFVLVQHLDPKHESRLGPLLAKATPMPVLEATEGLAILPDHVYVIPPDTTLTVAEGLLRLTPRGETRGLHLPIDRLFDSLSADRRTGAIGVVLSGSGSDGTLGLEKIKSEGGITFAQDEPSSKYPAMPRSATQNGSVDFVLSPEAIALELVRISQHSYMTPGLAPGPDANEPGEDELFRRVLRLLREATGVDFQEYRETTIRRRILRRMALHTHRELADYVRLLEEDRSEVDALFEDVLINVTRFFREPEAFEELKKTVFPEILKARTSAAPIRIWVPGCSTGQEAYSLAMALLEYLEEISSRIPLQIFATDLSDAVSLRKAREGRYPESIEAELTPERLQRFFTKEDGYYRISKAVRDLCVFARQDVAADPPFSRMDLISCRNLLIYLSPRLQKRVIPTFHYALSPGGFLLLGSAETIGPFADLFGVVDPRHRIYVKKGTHPRQYPHFQSGRAMAAGAPDMPPGAAMKIPVPGELPALQREAGRLLRLPAAQKAGKQAGMRVLPVELPGNAERCFLVVLDGAGIPAEPATPARGRRRWPWSWLRRGDLPAVQLRQELSATRESLQGVIEQQDVANEELRSAVEEALSANEELQSTNEELETAKEELQSVNEELTTVNEQLQNRNADLREAANQLSQADRRKDEFLATLAHELRNPLAPLRNALEILRLADGPEQALPAQELMERQVRHMTRLIDDLLDVSRINLGRIDLRRERIELAVAVSQAVEACTPVLVAAGHEISVLLPPVPLVLNADPLRLAQVLENLLGNAVRYTEPGGRIRLAVSREGDEAVLRLSDTGIGIAPDKLDEIWEPFVQADPSFERSRNGLGIGLTLARKLVQLHGGSAEAHSAGLGQGSEFTVRLPLVEDRRGAPGPPPEELPASAPLRILVVDDNVDQAESFGMLLQLMGHEVLVVHGGPAALSVAEGFKPALGLLDIGMPGLSGYEVARQLRQLPGLGQTILVAVSGYGTDEDRRRSKGAGFHAHWIKPVDLDVLRALLAQLGTALPC